MVDGHNIVIVFLHENADGIHIEVVYDLFCNLCNLHMTCISANGSSYMGDINGLSPSIPQWKSNGVMTIPQCGYTIHLLIMAKKHENADVYIARW